jgi:hypothetical protein
MSLSPKVQGFVDYRPLAAEIVENLEAALEQFKSIYEELGKDQVPG